MVLLVSRSNACTASSRCSSRVSSILLCEMPWRLCTNSMTVGMPVRQTSAASCSGPARQAVRHAANLPDRFVGQLDQLGVKRERLDLPELAPGDLDPLLGGDEPAGLPGLAVHGGQGAGVEVALIERHLGLAHDGRDDAGPCRHAADRADAAMLDGDLADRQVQPWRRRRARRGVGPSASSRSAQPGR